MHLNIEAPNLTKIFKKHLLRRPRSWSTVVTQAQTEKYYFKVSNTQFYFKIEHYVTYPTYVQEHRQNNFLIQKQKI